MQWAHHRCDSIRCGVVFQKCAIVWCGAMVGAEKKFLPTLDPDIRRLEMPKCPNHARSPKTELFVVHHWCGAVLAKCFMVVMKSYLRWCGAVLTKNHTVFTIGSLARAPLLAPLLPPPLPSMAYSPISRTAPPTPITIIASPRRTMPAHCRTAPALALGRCERCD